MHGGLQMRARLILVSLLMAALLCTTAMAHMPGAAPAPDVELLPIQIYDGNKLVEISIDDLAAYHGECTGQGPCKCPCVVIGYRAAEAGINALYGDEIPERSDIRIISAYPSMGSLQDFQYITGTGAGMDCKETGTFNLILADGTEVTDFSKKNIKKISGDIGPEDCRFTIIRESTGESIDLAINDDIFPSDYFDLRKKVKITKDATPEESQKFLDEWVALRDAALTKPAWELFKGIDEPPEEEPDVFGGGIFLSIFILFVAAGIIIIRRK